MTRMRPDELDEHLDDPGTFVLDIRPRDTYREDAIDGSVNVPVYDALRNGDESALRGKLGRIPDDQTVVTVCKVGIVAKRATTILTDEGYEAVTLAGGMSGWRGYENDSFLYKLRSVLWRLR